MLSLYFIDGEKLRMDEEALMKGFLNAALNGLVRSSGDSSEALVEAETQIDREDIQVGRAVDYAERMIRELRRRIRTGVGQPAPSRKRYAIVSESEVVEAWLAQASLVITPSVNRVLKALRGVGPLLPEEIARLATVGLEPVRILIDAQILVPVESEE